ncbi:MAG TPA: SurA N-terminal domain-containing protein [Candidatus Saccharimonadales bacterium]|nr:SurA N-terminal domain-containing protein [Candidatus Saccharimonadales bacterium]
MRKKIRGLIKKGKGKIPTPRAEAELLQEKAESAPRITNETVAEHREKVIGSARKYIYPLQHSKHRIVLISTSLFIAAVVFFFSYSVIALYRLQSTSTFLYRVTQVLPLPVAKAGKNYVAYENYLFELRHYMHYYQTQQKLDFKSESGRQQLADFKKRALDDVVNAAYVKELAASHHISVTDKEVNDEIAIVRAQNRLGGSDRVFEDVLKDYWGWSVDDFKRELRQQLLAQKVLSVLDTVTTSKADKAFGELKVGGDFGAIAKKYSDDGSTKDIGGDLGQVDRTNRDLSAQTVDTLFKLQPGQYSEVINIGYSLEIVKNIEAQGDKIHGAHILFNFQDINTYLNDLKDKEKTRLFVHL